MAGHSIIEEEGFRDRGVGQPTGRVHSTNNADTKQVPAVKSVYVFARESDPTAVCFDKNEKII